jgi:hypothetical protein
MTERGDRREADIRGQDGPVDRANRAIGRALVEEALNRGAKRCRHFTFAVGCGTFNSLADAEDVVFQAAGGR